jgi:hypothetical protein
MKSNLSLLLWVMVFEVYSKKHLPDTKGSIFSNISS